MTDTLTPETPAELAAKPTAQWGDPRVQAVYECLCSMEVPPAEQHWEGWTARRIVDRLATLAASSTAPEGWSIETGEAGFTGDRWVCVRNRESQCGQDFYEDSDRLMFGFLSALAAAPAAAERKPLTDGMQGWVAYLREAHDQSLDGNDSDARSTILQVAEQIEAAMKPFGWTRTADRLPEKNTEVMVFFQGFSSLASTGQYTGSAHDHGGWCYPSENFDDARGEWPKVTHWMLLPAAPAGTAAQDGGGEG